MCTPPTLAFLWWPGGPYQSRQCYGRFKNLATYSDYQWIKLGEFGSPWQSTINNYRPGRPCQPYHTIFTNSMKIKEIITTPPIVTTHNLSLYVSSIVRKPTTRLSSLFHNDPKMNDLFKNQSNQISQGSIIWRADPLI